MPSITYDDLVRFYGNVRSYYLLLALERLAQITSDIQGMDEDCRFQAALEALNNIDFAVQA